MQQAQADYDAVVVGARVAGASLALLLGKQGRKVLLVDRDRFPSDTLSTHYLHPPAVGALDRLGVLPDVEAIGLRRITRIRTHVEDCLVEGPLFGQPPYTYALAPRRSHLDGVLVEHARRHSVEFRDRTLVDGLLTENGQVVGVSFQQAGGRREEVWARVVVGADGRHSRVAEWVNAPRYRDVPAMRPGYYAYFRGVEPLAEPAAELWFEGQHMGFLFPMEPGLDCIALELQPEDFEVYRADLEARFEARVQALHGLKSRLQGARREGPIYGTRGIDNYFRQSYGPGWALVGDAACCLDPSTGFGILDAFSQALPLAEVLGAALDGADWETTLAAYQRQRDEALTPIYEATIAFTRQEELGADAKAWLRATLGSPGMVRTLALSFPAAVATPGVYPPPQLEQLAGMARAFGAGETPAKSRAA